MYFSTSFSLAAVRNIEFSMDWSNFRNTCKVIINAVCYTTGVTLKPFCCFYTRNYIFIFSFKYNAIYVSMFFSYPILLFRRNQYSIFSYFCRSSGLFCLCKSCILIFDLHFGFFDLLSFSLVSFFNGAFLSITFIIFS